MKRSLNILAALVAISLCRQASAAIFTPPDVASLIADITTANTNGEDDTIELATDGTYTLTAVNNGQNGLPLIVSDTGHKLVIHGNGATLQRSTVLGTSDFRIFQIDTGADVTIDGLTITNCKAAFGGGIYNAGTLTVTNSTISGNSATGLEIRVGGAGGGIYNDHATLRIRNSTLSGNSATGGEFGGDGGGIYNDDATLTISNSTLSDNSASNSGGGIENVASNTTATLTVTNSTLSGNSASFFGGGIFNRLAGPNGSAALTIGDTVLDAGARGANIANFGTIASLGYNLSSDAAGGDGTTVPGGFLNATGDIRNTDPMLGSLQDNGGPTFTHELLTDSPAIDAGDPSFIPPPDYDQRGSGYPRVENGRIDIGAFEAQSPDSDLLIGIGVDKTTVKQGDLLTYTITVQNFGPDAAINAVVNDVLASGSTFVSAHANKGSFTRPPVGQTGTVTWYLGDILSSGQESAQIVVTVIVRGKTTITNTGNVSSLSDDPNTANNTASIAVSVASGKGGGGGGGHGHH
jgi:uncharacterized repeat protein (TIGR01451 family)